MQNQIYADFEKLYYTDFELKNYFAMRQKWKHGASFKMSNPRNSTGIIFLNKAVGIYNSNGESFVAKEKSIVCLPQGSRYTCLNYNCTETTEDAILVQFNIISDNKLLTPGDKPFLIKNVNVPICAQLCNEAVMAYEAAIPSITEIKSVLYRLLAHIGKENTKTRMGRFECISAGIEILEQNPLLEISVEEISAVCNVTPCYFRKLFKQYSGKSPQQYRMDQKLNMAKGMLESGETSLAYIAEALNFESASYFCRVFKKKFNQTPGSYRNEANNPSSAQNHDNRQSL